MKKPVPITILALVLLVLGLVAITGIVAIATQQTTIPGGVYRPKYGSIHCTDEGMDFKPDYYEETLVEKGKYSAASHVCAGKMCTVGSVGGATCSGILSFMVIEAQVNDGDRIRGDISDIRTLVRAGQGDEIKVQTSCLDIVTLSLCTGVFPISVIIPDFCRDLATSPGTGIVKFDYNTPMYLQGWADGAPFALKGGKDCIVSDYKMSNIDPVNPNYDLDGVSNQLDPELSGTIPGQSTEGDVLTKTNSITGEKIHFFPTGYYKLFVIDWIWEEWGSFTPTSGKYAGTELWCDDVDGHRLYEVKNIDGMKVAAEKLERVSCCPNSDLPCSGNKVCDMNTFVCKEGGTASCTVDAQCPDKFGNYDDQGNYWWYKGVCESGYCDWIAQKGECKTDNDCYAKISAQFNRAECSYFECSFWNSGDIEVPCTGECCLPGGNWIEKKCTGSDEYCETHGGYVGYCKDNSLIPFDFDIGKIISDIFKGLDKLIPGMNPFTGTADWLSNLLAGLGAGLGQILNAILIILVVLVAGAVLLGGIVVVGLVYVFARKKK